MAIKPPISPIPMSGSKITVHQRKRKRFRDPLYQAHVDLQRFSSLSNTRRMDAYGLWDLVKEIGEKENSSVLNLEILKELIALCGIGYAMYALRVLYYQSESRWSVGSVCDLVLMHERLEKKKAEYAERMKKKVAAIHKEAEQRRH
ncbi:predicted protein [Arabidopsis lyrata subsp. lyrata]|uniref:Predicted protein n=1 Tax=Arabidopsis lyrata subsp. lyrata TaxID=81972 RepID=D7KL84_ARALL|nr:predicted protein [Arabidopsis lyrata subsp. lyrata]